MWADSKDNEDSGLGKVVGGFLGILWGTVVGGVIGFGSRKVYEAS